MIKLKHWDVKLQFKLFVVALLFGFCCFVMFSVTWLLNEFVFLPWSIRHVEWRRFVTVVVFVVAFCDHIVCIPYYTYSLKFSYCSCFWGLIWLELLTITKKHWSLEFFLLFFYCWLQLLLLFVFFFFYCTCSSLAFFFFFSVDLQFGHVHEKSSHLEMVFMDEKICCHLAFASFDNVITATL